MTGRYSAEMGQSGFTRIADTKIHHADHTAFKEGNAGTDDASNTYHSDIEKWVAVKVIGSAVFDTGTVMATGDAPDAADALIDGDVIQGPFRKIQLSSGTVYAYKL